MPNGYHVWQVLCEWSEFLIFNANFASSTSACIDSCKILLLTTISSRVQQLYPCEFAVASTRWIVSNCSDKVWNQAIFIKLSNTSLPPRNCITWILYREQASMFRIRHLILLKQYCKFVETCHDTCWLTVSATSWLAILESFELN